MINGLSTDYYNLTGLKEINVDNITATGNLDTDTIESSRGEYLSGLTSNIQNQFNSISGRVYDSDLYYGNFLNSLSGIVYSSCINQSTGGYFIYPYTFSNFSIDQYALETVIVPTCTLDSISIYSPQPLAINTTINLYQVNYINNYNFSYPVAPTNSFTFYGINYSFGGWTFNWNGTGGSQLAISRGPCTMAPAPPSIFNQYMTFYRGGILTQSLNLESGTYTLSYYVCVRPGLTRYDPSQTMFIYIDNVLITNLSLVVNQGWTLYTSNFTISQSGYKDLKFYVNYGYDWSMNLGYITITNTLLQSITLGQGALNNYLKNLNIPINFNSTLVYQCSTGDISGTYINCSSTFFTSGATFNNSLNDSFYGLLMTLSGKITNYSGSATQNIINSYNYAISISGTVAVINNYITNTYNEQNIINNYITSYIVSISSTIYSSVNEIYNIINDNDTTYNTINNSYYYYIYTLSGVVNGLSSNLSTTNSTITNNQTNQNSINTYYNLYFTSISSNLNSIYYNLGNTTNTLNSNQTNQNLVNNYLYLYETSLSGFTKALYYSLGVTNTTINNYQTNQNNINNYLYLYETSLSGFTKALYYSLGVTNNTINSNQTNQSSINNYLYLYETSLSGFTTSLFYSLGVTNSTITNNQSNQNNINNYLYLYETSLSGFTKSIYYSLGVTNNTISSNQTNQSSINNYLYLYETSLSGFTTSLFYSLGVTNSTITNNQSNQNNINNYLYLISSTLSSSIIITNNTISSNQTNQSTINNNLYLLSNSISGNVFYSLGNINNTITNNFNSVSGDIAILKQKTTKISYDGASTTSIDGTLKLNSPIDVGVVPIGSTTNLFKATNQFGGTSYIDFETLWTIPFNFSGVSSSINSINSRIDKLNGSSSSSGSSSGSGSSWIGSVVNGVFSGVTATATAVAFGAVATSIASLEAQMVVAQGNILALQTYTNALNTDYNTLKARTTYLNLNSFNSFLQIGGSLSVNSSIAGNNGMYINGFTTLRGGLSVSSDATLNSNVQINNKLTVANDIITLGKTYSNGISCDGVVQIDNDIGINGKCEIAGDLLTGDIEAYGNILCTKGISCNEFFSNSLTRFNDKVYFNGKVISSSEFVSTGLTTLKLLSVGVASGEAVPIIPVCQCNGNMKVNGNLIIDGNLSIYNGNLIVMGDIIYGGQLKKATF